MVSSLPPDFVFGKPPAMSGPRGNYVDLLVYYEQIKHLLEYDEEPPAGSMG
jgi:hypothetical protein